MATLAGTIDIQTEKHGDVLILHFKGKLDALSSPNAEKKIFEWINAGEHKLIFDFSHVDYLSSAGLRVLLSTRKRLKALAGTLLIISVTPNVMDVLVISGFDHVLELSPTLEDALKKIQG
jgi:anti-sigma B factor antagonist/stage II sporulation protein AA (anti-sigma F factor antagonist)